MPEKILDHGAHRILLWQGAPGAIAQERDAVDLIGAARSHDLDWVALPADCLHDDFFKLESRLAGGFVQKFVNYGVKLTIVGDISPWLERSSALRAFVIESNRGNALWFVASESELAQRLHALAP